MNNTTEYKGNQLGQSIKSDWELTEVSVDHIENATDNATKIEIPEWWANKNIA